MSVDVSGSFLIGNQQIVLTINDRDSIIKNWVIEVFKTGVAVPDGSANIITGVVSNSYYTVGTPCVIYIPFMYYQLSETQPIFAAAANSNGLGFNQYNWNFTLN